MENVKKNDELIVNIVDYGADGEGIAKINGYTIFVSGALKGEKCKIHILKVLKTHAFAKVIQIIEKSSKRVEPDCTTFDKCGGCDLRHIAYSETLKIKQEKVQNLVNKMLKNKVKVNETVGMENPTFYRNKAIYPVTQDKKVGIFAKRSHNIIPINECKIQTKISQEISKYILDNWKDSIYDEKTGKGLLRNIMLREGFKTNEIMLVLVQNGAKNVFKEFENSQNGILKGLKDNASQKLLSEKTKGLSIKKLIEKFPEIKTIIINVNTEKTNVVLSRKNIIVYGDGTIKDRLGDYEFKISPNSFYQVNPVQTEKLYNLAIEGAKLKKDDILCDLYCGIGTIGIFASKYVEKVYGVEIVEEAIKDAKQNAKINNVDNIEFIQGDVEVAFNKMLDNGVKPSVVIVDPPRKGLDSKTVQNLCNLKLDRLVYVSCNPATLMRDLQVLEDVYKIDSITPVDNFCYSSHIECVAVLEIKEK